MLVITKREFETTRLCELENKFYEALVRLFSVRCGHMGLDNAEKVIRKNWTKTLKEFDNNSFMSVYEVFQVVA